MYKDRIKSFINYYLNRTGIDFFVQLYVKQWHLFKWSFQPSPEFLLSQNSQLIQLSSIQKSTQEHNKLVVYFESNCTLTKKNLNNLIWVAKFARMGLLSLNRISTIMLQESLSKNNIFYFTDFEEDSEGLFSTVVGRDVNINKNVTNKRILAIICTYNEEDVICEVVDHLINQGLDVCIIDDASTDNTLNILQKKYGTNKKIIIRTRAASKDFVLFDILKLKEAIAKEFSSQYDWFMHLDSDEIRISPFPGYTLQNGISFADSLGYNAIDFTVIDFRYDQTGVSITKNFEKNLNLFEFGKRPGHFAQIKCWKKTDVFQLAGTGGHNVNFEGIRVYPIKFLLKHYPYRNNEQAQKKLFKDRAGRIDKANKDKGWHGHYLKHMQDGLKWDLNDLADIRSINFNNRYMFERISGVGIERE